MDKLNIYVASSSKNTEQAAGFMQVLRDMGHKITYDWTVDVNQFGAGEPAAMGSSMQSVYRNAAINDRQGVRDCDLFILIWDPRVFGGVMEMGMAMELGKRIWIIGETEPGTRDSVRWSVFYLLPDISFEVKYGWEAVQELEHWTE